MQIVFGQSFITKTMQYNGVSRGYKIFLPRLYDGREKVPLMLNFHGGNQNIQAQVDLSNMNQIADTANFIVVYPQALEDPSDGNSTNWMRKQPTSFDDVPFVSALIDEVSSNYSIDIERVYACGYSLGGEFSFELACKLNHKIAAIAPVARPMTKVSFENCNPVHPTAVLIVMGTNDDFYNGIEFGGTQWYYSAMESADYWNGINHTNPEAEVSELPNLNPTDGSSVSALLWKNGDNCTQVKHLKINGGGHTWPGSVWGNQDINGSEEIWNFLSKFDINGLIDCSTNSNPSKISSIEIQIVPNPCNHYLKIFGLRKKLPFRILSIGGEEITRGNIDERENQIETDDLSPGLYFLELNHQIFKVLKN